MQVTHNEYMKIDATVSILRIASKKVGVREVRVNTADVLLLQQFTWCFEDSKQLCYTMDMKMETAGKIFGYATPRIYMWKYLFLHRIGCLHGTWNRKNKLEYTSSAGVMKLHPLCS